MIPTVEVALIEFEKRFAKRQLTRLEQRGASTYEKIDMLRTV